MPLTLSNSSVHPVSSPLHPPHDALKLFAANSQRTGRSPGLAPQECSELTYAKPAFPIVKSLLALCHLAGSFMSADYS